MSLPIDTYESANKLFLCSRPYSFLFGFHRNLQPPSLQSFDSKEDFVHYDSIFLP